MLAPRGTARLAPEAPPKPRLQFQWWSKLLKLAARNKQVEFGTVCNLAYAFAARDGRLEYAGFSFALCHTGAFVYSNTRGVFGYSSTRGVFDYSSMGAAPTVWIGPVMEPIPKLLRSLGQIMQLRLLQRWWSKVLLPRTLWNNGNDADSSCRLPRCIGHWYCGIEKSQILDIMRDASAPLNLEETLAFKCLVR
ncbi:hypothetical protein AK812_SmicGene45132 [Symbiodinium microadriaticum]|uniref:Uncharacterized protein n=1 Tax=Symbiodinium microadriaticum TaxID=2951 RepID=A0A1Q9BWU2_SYMMI|nr:hypothetical protein AK812_SmicGene45132 [Symbiodinium microadriaticum]CAE7909471.1 unnamed protein product [Symbiodinium microadriaticum]